MDILSAQVRLSCDDLDLTVKKLVEKRLSGSRRIPYHEVAMICRQLSEDSNASYEFWDKMLPLSRMLRRDWSTSEANRLEPLIFQNFMIRLMNQPNWLYHPTETAFFGEQIIQMFAQIISDVVLIDRMTSNTKGNRIYLKEQKQATNHLSRASVPLPSAIDLSSSSTSFGSSKPSRLNMGIRKSRVVSDDDDDDDLDDHEAGGDYPDSQEEEDDDPLY